MILRLTFAFTLLVVLFSCEKKYLNESSKSYVPVSMFVTNESRDTASAIRYDFTFNADLYITGRTKWVDRKKVEETEIRYDQRRQISSVLYKNQSSTDTFFYSYDLGKLTFTVVKKSSIPGTGSVVTYKYSTPPQDKVYFYPLSRLGRLVEQTDSSYENGSFTKKVRREYFYSASSTYDRDVYVNISESFPGAPNVSTLSGHYRFNQKYLGNPFAIVSPDFVELPEHMREPWPFIRNGYIDYFKLSSPSWASGERDVFEVSKNFGKTNLPEEIRRTQSGRRSGVITVNYFRYVYEPR